MKHIISWEEARTKMRRDDPKGFSKLFVDESCGAEHIRFHVTVTSPEARAHPPHTHDDEEEIFYVLEGVGEVTIDGENFRVEAGTSVFVPPGKTHGIRNAGDTPLKYMVIICRC